MEYSEIQRNQFYYKEEIAERFEKGTDGVRMYLINQNYLKDFSKEEFESLFRSVGNRYRDDLFWRKMGIKELFESFLIHHKKEFY